MKQNIGAENAHPTGESENGLVPVVAATAASSPAAPEAALVLDTPGGRYRANFDEQTPLSSLGPLVFFAQFLQASGRFEALCRDAPLDYRSPNPPAPPSPAASGTATLLHIVNSEEPQNIGAAYEIPVQTLILK